MIKENVKNYKVIPIGKRVLVKPVEKVEQTNSGIILPDSQVQQKPQGTIIARGPEVVDDLQIGDFVEWEHMDTKGSEYIHEGETHIILFDQAIKVKLEDV